MNWTQGDSTYIGSLQVDVISAGLNQIQTAQGSKNHDNVQVGWFFHDGNWSLGQVFLTAAFDGDESLTITQDGKSVTVAVSAATTFNQLVAELNEAFAQADMPLTVEMESFARGLVFTSTKVGTRYNVTATANNWGGSSTFELSTVNGQAAQDAVVQLVDVETGQTSQNYTLYGDELRITAPDAALKVNNLAVTFTQDALTSVENDIARLDVNRGLVMQLGANRGESLLMRIGYMASSQLGRNSRVSATFRSVAELRGGGLSTRANANKAIALIDKAIADVSSERAKLGALHNRLEHTMRNLGVAADNLTASESRIRDADMAEEMIRFVRHQILSQTSTMMMAHANLSPQALLQLLT